MPRKISLQLDDEVLGRLAFLCDGYAAPAHEVVSQLVHGAFEAVRDQLEARRRQLEQAKTHSSGDLSDPAAADRNPTTAEEAECTQATECGQP